NLTEFLGPECGYACIALSRSDGISMLSRSEPSPWILDSGASSHMANNRKQFIGGLKRFPTPRTVTIANGGTLMSYGAGTAKLGSLTISDVWFVPGLRANLLSVNAFNSQGCVVFFRRRGDDLVVD